jgi:hypothetical protein
MFASMFSDLAACASHIEAYVDPRLLSLMQYSFPAIRFHSLHNLAHLEQTHFDHLLFMGSLGHAFRRSALDFSGAPYLKIPDAVSAKWRSTLANLPGKKIGIGWRGGTTTTNEAGRNLPLDQLQLLLEDERFSFVTLQHDAKPDEIEWLQRMSGNRLTVIQSQDVEDMVQLGGLIQALDDVVTTQNTNVHLAGALGSSCKAIMPVVPTWSYGAQGSAMNWYRAVKLYRRSANEPLATLIARLCRDII